MILEDAIERVRLMGGSLPIKHCSRAEDAVRFLRHMPYELLGALADRAITVETHACEHYGDYHIRLERKFDFDFNLPDGRPADGWGMKFLQFIVRVGGRVEVQGQFLVPDCILNMNGLGFRDQMDRLAHWYLQDQPTEFPPMGA